MLIVVLKSKHLSQIVTSSKVSAFAQYFPAT